MSLEPYGLEGRVQISDDLYAVYDGKGGVIDYEPADGITYERAMTALAILQDTRRATANYALFKSGKLAVTPEQITRLTCFAWQFSVTPLAHLSKNQWLDMFRYGGFVSTEPGVATPPESITLYRGGHPRETESGFGMSWTSDRETAEFFANDYHSNRGGCIFTAEVKAPAILAHINTLGKNEYVIDPDDAESFTLLGSELAAAP
ncbi:hypothetical protein WG915_04865 [Corynebacterium sp. H128]|uniref:hypothetical protein n=1 Tax=Corynebacterium sp. H128 TaxID=3133427 RepID=UPI00309FD96F